MSTVSNSQFSVVSTKDNSVAHAHFQSKHYQEAVSVDSLRQFEDGEMAIGE